MMMDFNFDMESFSELGLSPELLHEDDLLLALQDVPVILGKGPIKDEEEVKEEFYTDIDTCSLIEMTSDLSSFMEMDIIPEVTPITPDTVDTVINIDDILEECGITVRENKACSEFLPVEIVSPPPTPPTEVPSSNMEESQKLIDDVSEFLKGFDDQPMEEEEVPVRPSQRCNVDAILEALSTGNVTMADPQSISLTEEDLNKAITTSVVTKNGENVVIIIAPPSPAHSDASFVVPPISSPAPSSVISDYESSDPDYNPLVKPSVKTTESSKPRRKYQRRKQLSPPVEPYYQDKKERKKAQNRTAAFRYREKKKQEQDKVDEEVQLLTDRNLLLKEKMGELSSELGVLKKLMTEAGLGKYANVVKI